MSTLAITSPEQSDECSEGAENELDVDELRALKVGDAKEDKIPHESRNYAKRRQRRNTQRFVAKTLISHELVPKRTSFKTFTREQEETNPMVKAWGYVPDWQKKLAKSPEGLSWETEKVEPNGRTIICRLSERGTNAVERPGPTAILHYNFEDRTCSHKQGSKSTSKSAIKKRLILRAQTSDDGSAMSSVKGLRVVAATSTSFTQSA